MPGGMRLPVPFHLTPGSEMFRSRNVIKTSSVPHAASTSVLTADGVPPAAAGLFGGRRGACAGRRGLGRSRSLGRRRCRARARVGDGPALGPRDGSQGDAAVGYTVGAPRDADKAAPYKEHCNCFHWPFPPGMGLTYLW